MARPKTSKDNQVEKIGSFVVDPSKTLEDNFAMLKTQTAALEEYKKGLEKENVKKQTELKKQAIKEWYEYEAELESKGYKTTEAQRQKFINEEYKEKVKQEIELIKKAGILQTKEDKKQQKLKLAQEWKDNQQLYKDLRELEKSGKELTPEQKRVMEQAKKDSRAGWKTETIEKFKKGLGLDDLNKTMERLGNVINQGISTYSKYQLGISARLQGYRGNEGDVFSQVEKNLTKAVGVTPYFKTETMLNNLQALVEQGIASNIEQRAFLQTAKDGIATTFSANDAALLRIIRLQQSDSTAARLGMEAYLTRYLNNLVENTEYLQSTFDNVENALLEASSQMGASQATEFEYIVQKWLGALTGTGLSEATAHSIAQAVGYLGSGDIGSLSNSNMQNLLVMSASKAGLNYSDLLTNGLNAYNTNKLLYAMADYMAGMSAGGNNVTKSQLAQTFGVSISDLTAAKQLSSSFKSIYNNMMSYSGMYGELESQMGKLVQRTAISEMISNVGANAKFSLASSIASNPALNALWQITDMIQGATNGINIPAVSVMGNMVDLNTTVENLMKLGVVGAGSLSLIGDIINGVGNTVNPAGILGRLNIGAESKTNTITRGTGLKASSAGLGTSVSTYVGNSSSGDLYESTLNSANDSANKELSQKVAEADNPTKNIYDYMVDKLEAHMQKLDDNVLAIQQKIEDGVSVEVRNYGLVGINV